MAKTEDSKINMDETSNLVNSMTMETQTENQLTSVFDNYFDLKDALVQTNGKLASEKSKALLIAIKNVKMDSLTMDVHMVWMKVLVDLKKDAELIANTKEISKQRDHFMSLSKNIFTLMKIAKYEQPVYYQFCPMANDGKGANWLSKENAIKNPYYGSEMMTCGKTIEILNNK